MEISRNFGNYMKEKGCEELFRVIISKAPTWIKERYEKYQNQLDEQLRIINKNFDAMFELSNSVEEKSSLMKEREREIERVCEKKMLPLRLVLNSIAPLIPEAYLLLNRMINKKHTSRIAPTIEMLGEGE